MTHPLKHPLQRLRLHRMRHHLRRYREEFHPTFQVQLNTIIIIKATLPLHILQFNTIPSISIRLPNNPQHPVTRHRVTHSIQVTNHSSRVQSFDTRVAPTHSSRESPLNLPRHDEEDDISRLEREFSRGIFCGVLGNGSPRGRVEEFEWLSHLRTSEAPLLVVNNCMRRAGFPRLGNYLMKFLREEPFEDLSLAKSVASFIRCLSVDIREHPLAIVNRIFYHSKADMLKHGSTHYKPFEGNISVPKYASLLMGSQSPFPQSEYSEYTTQHALINWAVQRTVERVNDESAKLCRQTYFTRVPSVKVSWDLITRFNFSTSQEIIAKQAPALFSLLTTAACSEDMRLRLLEGASRTTSTRGSSTHQRGQP
ncbi:hypothetical protein VNI00_015933 [Paramarasmius palmivorus]|uniref:Uncharacterized protein n=1 Tax=Paramarasmius palmivorus TaxID=297713 RepID=A0AAW0BGJ4_9AGAR